MGDWQSALSFTATDVRARHLCRALCCVGLCLSQKNSQRSVTMKSLWKAYCQTFKDIISNTAIFTTLILSVLFYSFFYPTAYQAQQAEALPIIIVDEEQSNLSTRIIGQVAQSPNVEIEAITGNFAEAKQWVESQKADGILLLPDNLSQSLRHGETGGIGLYLSTANFLVTKQI